ncbi:MAG TPA: ECF-type sigma factor [Gemmataceae bacterium]|jgi:DNA-directed RNA polymerase specialized sigma24 family protein
MPSAESVTIWIQQLKEGERAAVEKLWEGYFARLVRQSQRWLRRTRVKVVDAEDIALSAFKSFCLRAEQGRFPKLFDRDDLWQLLVVIAFRKMCNQVKHEAVRQPRNGRVYPLSALTPADADDSGTIFSDLIGRDPDPALAEEVAESCRRLLETLPTQELRDVAVWKLEGDTNAEIAAKLNGGEGRSEPTAERKLARIRKIWAKEIDS